MSNLLGSVAIILAAISLLMVVFMMLPPIRELQETSLEEEESNCGFTILTNASDKMKN